MLKIGDRIKVKYTSLPSDIQNTPAANDYYLIVGYEKGLDNFIILMPHNCAWLIQDSDIKNNQVDSKYLHSGGWYISERDYSPIIQNETDLDNESEGRSWRT